MTGLDFFKQLLMRLRYPISLPEDVATALGVYISNFLTYQEFVTYLSSPSCRPTTLVKYMPREEAEKAFKTALRKEKFCRNSSFSYYFNEGWLEFTLQFDDHSRLRRVYLNYKDVADDQGIEIRIAQMEQINPFI